MRKKLGLMLAMTLISSGFAANAMAGDKGQYKITITNMTRGSLFTPALAVTHDRGITFFSDGEPASEALARLAEGGDTAPLQDALFATGKAKGAANSGPVLPGKSVTLMVDMDKDARHISLASMILPTNDGFIALNGVRGPVRGHSKVIYVPARDAGSELDDEHCTSIPGPHCGGDGFNGADGEGYVHIHAGIHGGGDLVAADYDWRNPVARITIERVK